MAQENMFTEKSIPTSSKRDIGAGLHLEVDKTVGDKGRAKLYRSGVFIKGVDLADKAAKRLFVTEAVELGAIKLRLADTLGISRQTIDNYLECKRHFSVEGLIHGYTPSVSKSLRTQRKEHADQRVNGNKAHQLADIRKQEQEAAEKELERQLGIDFPTNIPADAQPYRDEHGWKPTRYAGVFTYLIMLVSRWRWLFLIIGFFGLAYPIFLVFLLMAALNTRTINQLKHIRNDEAGLILGLGRLPSVNKVREWFYHASSRKQSKPLLSAYFRHQINAGLVGLWLWFTDGHLLPYSGKEKVRPAYNTQRRMMMPGRMSQTTCDLSGRVVASVIEEGQGDLRGRILELTTTLTDVLPMCPVCVFDREGTGTEFFWDMVHHQKPFVTWEKNADQKALAALAADQFTIDFELNGKRYKVFEDEKSYTHVPDGGDPVKDGQTFTLRRIYVWNRTSNRRTSGLAWTGDWKMGADDCARAILNRWGASENTFKHMQDRHPVNYQPGFEFTESERQDIANPEIKKIDRLIKGEQKDLARQYKEHNQTKESLKKDGTPRANSKKAGLQVKIDAGKAEIARLKEKKSQLPGRVDVSTLEDYKSFKTIDNEGKYLFDFVLSSVWNARKEMVDMLRPVYNNEDDVVDVFYNITYSQGWIKSTKTEVTVRLEPMQQPRHRSAQEQLCRKLTDLGARLPNGKRMIVEVGESPLKK